MSILDVLMYSKNWSQSLYDGALFGLSNVLVCYVVDFIMISNNYNMILKPVVATIVYMYFYQNMYL